MTFDLVPVAAYDDRDVMNAKNVMVPEMSWMPGIQSMPETPGFPWIPVAQPPLLCHKRQNFYDIRVVLYLCFCRLK